MAEEVKGTANGEELSFEAALKELEEKVSKLEEGDLPLEEALECFKEGVRLIKICNEKLRNAETVISQLIEEEDGSLTVGSLNLDEDGA